MPCLNLTPQQLAVLRAALQVTLEADESLGLLEAQNAVSYEAMSGTTRRELVDLCALVNAVATEHQ